MSTRTVIISPAPTANGDLHLGHIAGPFLDAMPLHRWATEDDIAGPIVFLLSDDAAMISGVSVKLSVCVMSPLTTSVSTGVQGFGW